MANTELASEISLRLEHQRFAFPPAPGPRCCTAAMIPLPRCLLCLDPIRQPALGSTRERSLGQTEYRETPPQPAQRSSQPSAFWFESTILKRNLRCPELEY